LFMSIGELLWFYLFINRTAIVELYVILSFV